MKKILILLGSLLVLGLVIAGSFWAGMQYEANQSEQVRAAFINARGPAGDGQMPGERPGFPGSGDFSGQNAGAFGGGTTGVVKTIDGYILTLSTAQDVTTVTLTGDTRIEQTVSVASSELQPGMRVIVSGELDDAGAIIASQIRVITSDPAGSPYPAP